MSDDCLFCKIVAGDIPADVVMETETTFAFNDIDPKAPTHVLVIPKRHIQNANEVADTDAEVLAAMFATAQEVARLKELVPSGEEGGYRLVFNVGTDAGNTVDHLHMHVLGGTTLGQLA